MYNEDLDLWIARSLLKHLDANKGSLYMYLEQDLDKRDTSKQWIEIRYDGPETVQLNKNVTRSSIDVDIFINCPAEEDLFVLERLKGKVKKMLTCFDVLNDDGEVVFTLWPSDPKVLDYGRVDESRSAAAISCRYTEK